MKSKIVLCLILAVLILTACSCTFIDISKDVVTESPTSNEMPELPYDKNNYNLTVNDIDGNDITDRVIELWWSVNAIYNVDSDSLLELGDYYADFDGSAGFYEVLNFEEIVEQLFSPVGKRQLLNTKLGNVNFLQERNGKIYRLGPWKTGWGCGDSILEAFIKELTENKIILSIKFDAAYRYEDDDSHDYRFVDFSIVKIDNVWYVDNYVYPESTNDDEIFSLE